MLSTASVAPLPWLPLPHNHLGPPRTASALQAAAAACAPEQGCVSWQAPLGVEAHAVKLGVVGAARHKRPAAHAAGRLCAVAQLCGQLAGRAVSTHQHTPLHLGARCCGDSPQACGFVKRGTSDLQQGSNKSGDLTLQRTWIPKPLHTVAPSEQKNCLKSPDSDSRAVGQAGHFMCSCMCR